VISYALRVRRGCWNEIKKAFAGTSRDQAFHRTDGRARSAACEDVTWQIIVKLHD